ncbi:MAG TPA: IPT/TIG domain-containing protein [Acidobacteriota bacterium]|nr:IPT/TIG domain-containing protein [Acidobacteriota bacterium]
MKYLCFLFFSFLITLNLSAAEVISRNISWTLESGNDPFVQITNESEKPKILTFRILLNENSYRWRSDYEVPAGENRFVRVRDVLDQLSAKYPEVKTYTAGLVQLEYEGKEREVKTRSVNLNPKAGVTSEKEQEIMRAPVITSIDPPSGSPAGGTAVRIAGENFTESTSVKFGGVPAMRSLQSSEILIAVAPAHAPATVDIEVSNGRRNAKLANAFRYELEGPVITRVDPDRGPQRGGQRINIEGRNFQRGAVIKWDGREITPRFTDSGSISLVVPPGKSGSIGIEIINPDGKNFVLPDGFQYKGFPQAASVNPGMGNRSGGYTVTISGNNFEPGASVLFGGRYGQTTFINPSALAAVVPQGDSGYVDITISNPDGEVATLEQGFLYNEPPKIRSVIATPNPIVRLTQSRIVVEAGDPEVGELQYEFRVAQGPDGGYVIPQGSEAIYNSPNNVGIAIIQVTVYDEHGSRDQGTVEIQVQ